MTFLIFGFLLCLIRFCSPFTIPDTLRSSKSGLKSSGSALQTELRLRDDTSAPDPVVGPVMEGNFPDPCIIHVGNLWYSFATKTANRGVNVQIASSDNFVDWTIVRNSTGHQLDAMPRLPRWVWQKYPNTWAPDVSQLSDGTFILYFSATISRDKRRHCVGVAKSPTILGPYEAQPYAIFCNLTAGGAIDAFGFKESTLQDGRPVVQHYVAYKVDGNSMGYMGPCGNRYLPVMPTPIILQAVEADGFTLQGLPVVLQDNSGIADDGVIEAPSLVKSDEGIYVLFFSSGCFATSKYTVSYATSSALTGPYTRRGVLLRTGSFGLHAPGGADVDVDGKHMVFHAGTPAKRLLYTTLITIDGTSVSFSE